MESYRPYCPWYSRVMWSIVTTPRCPQSDTVQKPGLLTAKGFIDAVRKKEIIILTKRLPHLWHRRPSPPSPWILWYGITPWLWTEECSQLSLQGPLPTHCHSTTSCSKPDDLNLVPSGKKCALCQIACGPENHGGSSCRSLGDNHFGESQPV